MKKILTNYVFNAAAKTITFSEYASIELKRILLVTNITKNKIIYQFNKPALGGTKSGNILTLVYDTTTMTDADILQIQYDEDTDYKVLIDKANSNTTYIGKALQGSATNAAVWQIIKITTTGTVKSILYVNGLKNFINIWDNRTSLTYS